MELVNCHTHTELCGHGEGSVLDMAAAAAKAGVSLLVFTEHYPLTARFDSQGDSAVPACRMGEYFEGIERARTLFPSMEVVCGIEFDWLGDAEDRPHAAADLDRFDTVLASVHFLNEWPLDHPDLSLVRWRTPGEADVIWRAYFERWCAAAVSREHPFDIMAHPDLVKKFGIYPSFSVEALYDDAVEALLASGRMVEVNTSGAYCACKEMYPSLGLLERCCRAGIPCSVGSDAHRPAHIVRGIEDAYRLMYEAGYRAVTVPTSTGDRREIPIG